MVSCHEVLMQLSNYLDDDVDPALRKEIEDHLRNCQRCAVLADTTRKTIFIVGDERVFTVPMGYSERLHKVLDEKLGLST